MAAAIADLRGDLAAKGTYSADPIIYGQPAHQDRRRLPHRVKAKVWISVVTSSTDSAVPCRKNPLLSNGSNFAGLRPSGSEANDRAASRGGRGNVEPRSTAWSTSCWNFARASRPPSRVRWHGGRNGRSALCTWFGSIGLMGRRGRGRTSILDMIGYRTADHVLTSPRATCRTALRPGGSIW